MHSRHPRFPSYPSAATAAFCVLFCVLCLLHPQTVMQAVEQSVLLFATSVFPALFPFFVLTSVLASTGVLQRSGRFFAPVMRAFGLPGEAGGVFLMGAVSGYPVGAKLSNSLSLPQSDTERLCGLCNLAGPMFLTGTIASSLLGAPAFGAIMVISHLLSALAVSALCALFSKRKQAPSSAGSTVSASEPFSAGAALLNAISDGIFAMLRVCGAIVFFSALLSALNASGLLYVLSLPLRSLGVPDGLADAITAGFFEKTTACATVCAADLPLALKAASCSFFVAFGGCSILIQTRMFANVRTSRYWAYKLAQGLVSALFTYVAATFVSPQDLSGLSGISPVWVFLPITIVLFLVVIVLGRRRRC